MILGEVKAAIPQKGAKRSMSGGDTDKLQSEREQTKIEAKFKTVTFSEPKPQQQQVTHSEKGGPGGFNIFAALLGGTAAPPAEPAKTSEQVQKIN